MAAPKKEIELLPQESWEKTTFGKILKWVLSVGRYIVVATELVVILAFLSRFKLDRDLTDLYKTIEERQAIVEANQGFEEKFRFLQRKISLIEKIQAKQSTTTAFVDKLLPLIPIDVSIKNLSLDNQRIRLVATALSEEGLASFLNNLSASPNFENLSVTSVTSGSQKNIGTDFRLEAEFKSS
jgi:Tfp pilus assembly protein PilN